MAMDPKDTARQERLYNLYRTFFDKAEQERRWNPFRDPPWDKVRKDAPECLVTIAETFCAVESSIDPGAGEATMWSGWNCTRPNYQGCNRGLMRRGSRRRDMRTGHCRRIPARRRRLTS